MIDTIVGFACLPVSILLFLNQFGVTHLEKLFGISLLLVAALALVVLQAVNILDSHIQGHNLAIAYGVHLLLLLPSVIYGLSFLVALPDKLTAALPLIFACFIFTEGFYGFFTFA